MNDVIDGVITAATDRARSLRNAGVLLVVAGLVKLLEMLWGVPVGTTALLLLSAFLVLAVGVRGPDSALFSQRAPAQRMLSVSLGVVGLVILDMAGEFLRLAGIVATGSTALPWLALLIVMPFLGWRAARALVQHRVLPGVWAPIAGIFFVMIPLAWVLHNGVTSVLMTTPVLVMGMIAAPPWLMGVFIVIAAIAVAAPVMLGVIVLAASRAALRSGRVEVFAHAQ
ncbi:hypothetical protein [Microbacterium sp. YY-01]|uniref:hypothetical protein n=1 Tax=Microbacterium sp. YY-01 TaxID=3421634 RepID=UPI003D1835A2